ncbi:hypothetical protein H2203_003718 [Taxawa tesnikishii (nom. ined.)]|nr:hypothetical protein H2203_003718 [Dothideales sp. JES 119]
MSAGTARVASNPPVNRSTINGTAGINGTHGYATPPHSPTYLVTSKTRPAGTPSGKSRVSSLSQAVRRNNPNGSYKVSVVQETATTLKRKSMSELGAGVSQTANDSSFIDLVEWIRSERLATVPHKGSTWDKVLIRALHFIEQLHNFERAVQSFASDSDAAAQLGYGHTRLLLELGHENSEALDRALGFFYKCSLSVSSLLNRSGLLSVVSETQEQLCLMYTDLLTLVVEVSIRFYKTVHGMLSSEVSLDMHEVFGDTIETFRSRQDKITETLWSYQINSEGFSADEALDIRVLGKWLAPQDRVLAALGRDHTTFTDQQAEFTCLWFQDDLTKFLKGPDSFMLVNGQSGSGKTTLAAALRRPEGVRATSVERLGRYPQAPLDDADDLVMVIDGLDELVGGKPAGQDLLENLTRITGQGKRVKLIGLSQSLSMPSAVRGTQLIISREDTRDDIHAVIIKALMHCRHFNRKPGPEQESTIGRIIDASEGSFLRATLTCEVLKAEKTQDSFTKAVQTLQSSRPSVHDLVTRIVSVLEPSDDSKWLLSWLVDAARPLTYDEIESLFRTDVQRGVHSDKRVDLHSVTQTLRPLLSTHEDIVCVRHGLVHTALRTLFDQAKLPLPVKDRQMAFLLRALTYVKSTLRETIEPTLDNRDQGLPNKLFQRHPFLEYVIRYWPSHLKQTPIVPTKSGDANVPDEVKKAFPESTAMPILEWLCWDDQFPGAQEVDLHILVSRLRRHVFSENHPSVMQSYINCATYFELMKHSAEAGRYYFQAMNISLTVLSTFHPLTVECATRYLRLTEPLVTTSRTDIMTRREKVLNILITAYERQFGSTSDLVITTRQLLAEFYMHIHEEDRATEVLRIIHGTTSGKNGKDTDHARGISEHLRIKLGKAKGDRDLETYNPLFTDEDDEETVVSLDLGQIAVIIRKAESYLSQGKTSLAEQTYVELWQQLSESCRTTRAVEWHEKKIDTVIAYAKFLKTQKRESEASAFLTCLWQEYEHHELAFSESIISRLTETARMMKSVGQYSAALSIFKHVSSFFSTVRKEDSRSISQIEEEIAITSTEVVKHTLSSSSSTENTNTASASTFEEIFHSMITNQYKSVDSTVIMLAKRLTTLYMEQGKWSEAISTIQSTLQRTWSSFSAVSIHGVSYTSTFWQESVELAQLLAECYVHQRLLEKVEDVYVRLFRAVLSAPAKDNTPLLEKVTSLLVSFYDKHGYPDRAISVFQEVLVVYRTRLGPVHDVTIQTLYTLADRCRRHARSHPYWIEYCQQIVTSLNKDADICHANAMKALVFVANSYWEERRHAEAVTVFSILWNTFINRTKEYEQFKDTKFVSELYERYFQCLEETKADWEVLYRVTKQYRETCSKAFGASVAITTTATLALARISQRSESHTDEAISWYEEASKSSSSSSDTSISSTDIKQTLSTLYKRRILSQSSTASSETVQRATTIYEEQFSEARAKYGYTYEMTLSNLKELSMLYTRQQKTDIAMKELTTAVVEINTKETSLQKMLESATSIAQTFQACKLTQRCTELILELHRQIIAKEVKNSKFSFNLTKCGSAS